MRPLGTTRWLVLRRGEPDRVVVARVLWPPQRFLAADSARIQIQNVAVRSLKRQRRYDGGRLQGLYPRERRERSNFFCPVAHLTVDILDIRHPEDVCTLPVLRTR